MQPLDSPFAPLWGTPQAPPAPRRDVGVRAPGHPAVSAAAQLSEFSDSAARPPGMLYRRAGGSYPGAMSSASGSASAARGVCSAGLVLALAFGVSNARADGYDQALREGVQARDRARDSDSPLDWRLAAEQFMLAIAERDTLEARFELAEAASELSNVAVAYESYELSLELGLSGKAAEIASAFIDAHDDEVARLAFVGPAGSSLFVNGEQRARLPLARPLVVPAGRVRLRLVSPLNTPWEQIVLFEAQETQRLAPELVPKLAPEPVWTKEEPSWLGAHPTAIVLLSIAGVSLVAGGWFAYKYDERDTVASDARGQIMAALQNHVERGYFPADTVPCGQRGIAGGRVSFDPEFGVSEQQQIVSDYANACATFNERSDAADRYRTLSLVGFGIGAVASATVLTWYLTDDEPSAVDRGQAGPRLVPILSADTRGLLLDMAF